MLCGHEFKLAYTDTNDTAALDSSLVSISPAVKQLAEIRSLVAGSYHVRHDEDKAKKIDNDLVASFDNLTSIEMFDTAFLASSPGEIDESIQLMERIKNSGSWIQFWCKFAPMQHRTIRENPRYQALLKRMGLDDESVAALNKRMSLTRYPD